MNFPFQKKSSETIVVDGGAVVDASQVNSKWIRIFRPLSVFFLLLAFSVQLFFGGDLLAEKESLVRRWYQLLEQKQTEQLNSESLESLLSQIDSLEDEFVQFSRAVPEEARYDLVMSWVESLFESLRAKDFVELPELIAWRPVSEYDVKSSDLELVGITEYSFSFVGEYDLLMEFFAALRTSHRLLDVRALRNFTMRDDGLVAVDIALWSYHSSI